MTIELTVTTDLIQTIRRMRKSLRDTRDRAAHIDDRWTAVAMAGTVSNDHLMLLIQHPGIDRETVWTTLERRWPMVGVRSIETIEPRFELTVEQIVQLAVQHRGIEPIRVVIPAQRRAHDRDDGWGEPMPIVV